MKLFLLFCLIGIVSDISGGVLENDVFTTESFISSTHPMDNPDWRPPEGPIEEQNQRFWENKGQDFLKSKLKVNLNKNVAKNVILMIGKILEFFILFNA